MTKQNSESIATDTAFRGGSHNDVKALEVRQVAISDLKLKEANPRSHSARQLRLLRTSIQTYGFLVPVLVDEENNIVAGNARVTAARELGQKSVPVIRVSHLSEDQKRAFALADNRLTEISKWDEKLLAKELAALSSLSLDFSLEATGFEMAEIDLRIESLDFDAKDSVDGSDFESHPHPQVSKPGDSWQVGRHRLVCGSALDDHAFHTLMGTEIASMLFTDAPYNVRVDGHATGNGRIRHREFAMASGEMDSFQFTEFLKSYQRHALPYTTDGSIHFHCMDWRHASEMLSAGAENYEELKNICVWVKHNAGMGSLYRSQHELVFVYKKGIAKHQNNVQLGRFGRNRTNVWNYPGITHLGMGDEGNLLALHPTVKPVALIADAILDCSSRGEIVLDPFIGSGSSLLAAERTGRRCYGVEIDPRYVDTAIRRYEKQTGDSAVHCSTGRTFRDLEERGRG